MQDQFVGMFLEEWRDSEEYERRQEDIKMANMDWDEQEPMWARPVESPVSLPPPSPPRPDDGDDPWGVAALRTCITTSLEIVVTSLIAAR